MALRKLKFHEQKLLKRVSSDWWLLWRGRPEILACRGGGRTPLFDLTLLLTLFRTHVLVSGLPSRWVNSHRLTS